MRVFRPKRLMSVLLSVLVVAELVVSVVLGTVAQDTGTKIVEKELMDLSGAAVGSDIDDTAWPEGISKITSGNFVYDSGFSVDIAETDGEKYLKFNMDARNTVNNISNTASFMTGRAGDQNVFIKVSVPADYIPYLKDIKLDYIYNFAGYDTTTKSNAYYILGIGDGSDYGKDVQNADVLAPTGNSISTGTITKSIANMKKLNANNFIGRVANMNNHPEWTSQDFEDKISMDVIFAFSAPEIKTGNNGVKAGYYFGIKGISVTLEGSEDELNNLGKFSTELITFDEGATLDEVKANTKVSFATTTNSALITADAYKGTNAFLFKRWKGTSANDNDSKITMNLTKNITQSQGVTFMVKNIDDNEMNLKVWIAPGCYTADVTENGIKKEYSTKGKYQYVVNLPANMTEYQRVSIYWENVGLMDFQSYGYRWGTTSTSGYSITNEELASGLKLNFRCIGWTLEDAGIQFDEFEYITEQFAKERTTDLVSFKNSVASNKLPSDIAIDGSYNGSTEIVENTDGTKSLRVNYDAVSDVTRPNSTRDMTLMSSRLYTRIAVSVPKGALTDLKEMQVSLTNNRSAVGVSDNTTQTYTNTYYLIGLGDSVNKKYAKLGNKASEVTFINGESKNITVNPLQMLSVTEGEMTGYTSNAPVLNAEELSAIDTVYVYVTAPNTDGTEGESFQLDSIILYYNEPLQYNETVVRAIAEADEYETLNGTATVVNKVNIQVSDDNYDEFTTATEISVTDPVNAQSAVFINNLIEYKRNLKPFVDRDTAILHFFGFAEKETKVEFALVDVNGAAMTTVLTVPAATTKLYEEVQIKVKEIYDANVAADGEFAFDLSDIRAISVKPVTNDPVTVKLAKIQVLTGEYVSPTEDPEKQKTVTLVDFRNCDTGKGNLPENVTVDGNYGGTTEITEYIDGTKALKLNYDSPANVVKSGSRDMTLLYSRDYYRVAVSVPKGSFKDLKELRVDLTNNRSEVGVCDTATNTYTNVLYTVGVGDTVNSAYGKQGDKANIMTFFKGDASGGNKVITVPVMDMLSVSEGGLTNYTAASKYSKITAEFLSEVDTVYIFISAPNGDGKQGESVVINSIELYYNNAPAYDEFEVREIIHADTVAPTTSGKITAKSVAIGTDNPNNAEFKTAFEITVKDASNTESIVLKNELGEYHRNLKPFYEKETAMLHMFADLKNDTEFLITLVDKNGAELPAKITIKASTNRLYTEAQVEFKPIFDSYLAANSDFRFNMSDIRYIKVLPLVSEPCTVKIAGATLLTGGYVSSASDPEKAKNVNLINFDNCEVGTSQLPSNVTVSGYGGSHKIVKSADGSNALQVNLDQPVTTTVFQELHQNHKRTNIVLTVSVPKGSLEGLSKVNFTITNNGFPLSEQTIQILQSYCTIAVMSDNKFIKPGESAIRFTGNKGVPTTLTLNTKSCRAGTPISRVHHWLSESRRADFLPEDYSEFNKVTIYIAVPDVVGNEGYNFQINSIDLEFDDKPAYNEPVTRYVFDGESRAPKAADKTISVKENILFSNDVNYRNIKKTYTVTAKKGNTAPILLTNSVSKFLRNGESFLETSTFRMYYLTEKAMKLRITLEDFNGEKLYFDASLSASKSDKFDELVLPFKEIYDKFMAKNPDSKFTLTDFFKMEILPLTSSACEFSIASAGLWSKEPGSASSAGNYYYALDDDSARIEAYNYNIPDDFITTFEFLDVEAEIAANGTRIPAGAKVIKMVKVTLRNSAGDLSDPTGRFYVSFKLPDGIATNNVRMYEVFFDGSLKELRTVFDANNYITYNDFFNSKTFAILLIDPNAVGDTENGDGTADDSWNSDYEYEYIGDEETEGETVVKTPSKVVRKKKVIVYDEYYDTDYTWLWIVIGISAAVLVIASGIILFIIIRKKRKKEKESVAE